MLTPKRRRLKDHNLCFYGHKLGSQPDLKNGLLDFLKRNQMDICPEPRPGEWLWQALITAMDRCAFCVFETVTENRNAHIELGYALAKRLHTVVLVKSDTEQDDDITKWLPSDLAGLVQVRFGNSQDLPDKLQQKLPQDWFSVEERLEEPLRLATDLDRAYFKALLWRDPKSPIKASNLVAAAEEFGVSGSSNNSVARFLSRYDEVLQFEDDTMAPQPITGKFYDAWNPHSPATFEEQRIRLDCDCDYRYWLAKALAIKI